MNSITFSIWLFASVIIPSLAEENALVEGKDMYTTRETTSLFSSVKEHSTFTTTVYETGFVKATSDTKNYMHHGRQLSALSSVNNISDSSPSALLVQNPFIFDVEAPIKTMLSFCQNTHTCQNKSLTDIFETVNECCLPCDCSDHCYAAGTCCLDKTNGSKQHHPHQDQLFSRPMETCVKTYITGADFNNQTFMNSSYLLFQSCPESIDSQTKKKCLHPDVFKLQEVMPVFSQRTKRHYRNEFCSKCNNDSHNIVKWQTQLTCNASHIFPKLSYHGNISILDIMQTNPNCVLTWTPPINVERADHCFHEENIVSDCNNPILDNLCKQYYAPVKGGDFIYRNVFCMECANPSNFTGIKRKCNPLQLSFDVVSFSSILSPSVFEEKTPHTDISAYNICDFPKRYNEKLDTCIRSSCAITEINVADDCKPIFSHLKGINLEYRLKLIYQISRADIWKSFQTVLFDSNIMTVVGLNESSESFCHAKLIDIKVSAKFVEIRTVYIKTVQATNIKNSYRKYKKSIEIYNEMVKENNNTFLLEMDKSGFEPILENSATFVSFTKSVVTHDCLNNIAMSKLQFCDTITFSENEFKINGNGDIHIENAIFWPGEYVLRQALNGTITYVQVCLDDYIATLKNVNKAKRVTSTAENGKKSKSGILFLLCAVIILNIH